MAFKSGKLTKKRLFALMVFLPTVAAAAYYGFFASDIYVSESKFLVRSAEKQATTPFGSMLQTAGLASGGNDTYSVYHYVLSRDALKALDENGAYRKSVIKPGIDAISRFNGFGFDDSFEALFDYYNGKVEVIVDSDSSISTLRVRAFDPKEAVAINQRLINLSEALVNSLSERSRRDMISFAEGEADRAIKKARETSLAVSNYRDAKEVFDPEAQSALQLQLVSKLQDQIIETKGRLSQTKYLAPSSPQINFLKKEVENLQKQINIETAKVAGGSSSLSKKSTEYEEYMLDRDVAKQHLATAISALEQAHSEALRQQLYLQLVAKPSLPDDATEPRRVESVLTVFVVAFFLWGITCMLAAGVREHYD